MLNEQTFVPGAYSAYRRRAIPPRPEGAGLPAPVFVKWNDLAAWHDGEFSIPPVKCAAHAAHHRGHLLAKLQIAIWDGVDGADAFDAQHTREGHAFGEAKTGMQLGSVEAEGLYLDADPARFGLRKR